MNDKSSNTIKYELANIYRDEFISIIKSRLGINIQQGQVDTLLKTIADACDKFDCEPSEFLDVLKTSTNVSPAIDYITTNITIGETYFFRDKRQMKLLEEFVLPKIINEKRNTNNLSIRIWSAGCSSGEEIYTLAMLLRELIPDIDGWSIFLLGTDINTKQLHKAVTGEFSEWSMRSIPPYYKNKYFSYDGKSYKLAKKIRSMAEFAYLNLNDDIYPSILNNTNAHDLIVCRNVLIYFDDQSISNLMKKITLCLVQHGFLLLGASDPVNLKVNYLVRHPENATLLMRASPGEIHQHEKQNHIIQPATEEIEELEEKPPLRHAKIEKKTEGIVERKVQRKHKPTIRKVVDPLELANQGKLQEAVNAFIKCIEEQKTNKQLYLDLAMTLVELNRFGEAEDALKKAIYIDSKFVMAHFQLGMLKMRHNSKSEGLKYLNNALRIAKKESPDTEVEGNPGMLYGKLAEILEKDILIFYE
jgi:chemotaxis protein methyltransferase CheR